MRRFRRAEEEASSPAFNEASALTVFEAYADKEDPNWMNMEGIANLVGVMLSSIFHFLFF
jgi:hypothetical protein